MNMNKDVRQDDLRKIRLLDPRSKRSICRGIRKFNDRNEYLMDKELHLLVNLS